MLESHRCRSSRHYWLAALDDPDEEAVEEHLFECDKCGERLRELIALVQGVRELARSGSLRMIVTETFLKSFSFCCGTWEGLQPAELAAVVSSVLYESRGDAPGSPDGTEVPTGKLRRALNTTRRLWTELRADEQRHRITQSREPEIGFVPAIYRWATTGDLAAALAASDASGTGTPLSAGDFVRWCRQVLDLLDQVRNAAPTPALRATAKRAINDIRRGVVAVDAG